MIDYRKINNVTGWAMFVIALLVYWITMEETASYWDCGEFIAVSYKLQVPHPPGAPLYLLLGRLFSFIAGNDVARVAYWVNFMSVLSSAFTILFLFWTITIFGRKMLKVKESEVTEEQRLQLMGAGAAGALAYTFCDSFWFSAVEAEVYAMSSFFTAFVVWAMLKWEAIEDESRANRWLILIAYIIGLSIGIHLLNLLTFPALGLIYYFKKFKTTNWGIVAALMISGFLVLFVNNLIVPGLPTLAGKFEIFFVNALGLFFGSGALFFALVIIGALTYGIYFTQKKGYAIWNTFLLATAFVLIGYSSYTTIVVRSNYDTLINENAPKDVMSFIRYLEREQYGSRPLLYGPYFTSKPIDYKEGSPIYSKGKDSYEITDRQGGYIYAAGQQTILPRAWDTKPDSKETYREVMGLEEGQQPSFLQNISYMIKHQIGTMYGRYFMWNFAGRESDIQDADWLAPSQWFVKAPEALAKNKGRNNFFLVPFLLGLLGMYFHYMRDTKNFTVAALLFFMLGVAIVLYLNSVPNEPRERDYIYAGSFYAFTFWIGLAVIGLSDVLKSIFKKGKMPVVAAALIGLTAPALMAKDGWDDHDRSDRFFSVDIATNYLTSCEKNGVLFTGGDNDTFPLWYAQEVEGVRTDLRVIVFSYFNTDWYIAQTCRAAYESAPIPYTLSLKDYRQGGPNDYLLYADFKIQSVDLKQFLALLKQHSPQLLDEQRNVVPSKIITLDVNPEEIRKKGIVPKELDSLIVDKMVFRLRRGNLEKKDLAFLDMLATTNWDRPMYVNETSRSQLNIDIEPYTVMEGNAYRILPVKSADKNVKLVNLDRSYDLMMRQYRYRGLDNPKVYNSEDYRGFVVNQRSSFNDLAIALINANQNARADSLLQFSLKKIPDAAVPYDMTTPHTIDMLFQLGQKEQAKKMADLLGNRAIETVNFMRRGNMRRTRAFAVSVHILGTLQRVLYENKEDTLAKKFEGAYDSVIEQMQMNGR